VQGEGVKSGQGGDEDEWCKKEKGGDREEREEGKGRGRLAVKMKGGNRGEE